MLCARCAKYIEISPCVLTVFQRDSGTCVVHLCGTCESKFIKFMQGMKLCECENV